MMDMSRDSIAYRHCLHQRYVPYAVNSRPTSQKIWCRFLVRTVQARGMTLNWFQLQKWKLHIPYRDHLVMNFRRSIIIAELWRPEVARRWKKRIFAFFL